MDGKSKQIWESHLEVHLDEQVGEKSAIDQMVSDAVGIPMARELMEKARSGHLCVRKKAEGAYPLKGDEMWFDGCVGQWGDLLYLQRCWVMESRAVRAFKSLMVDVKPLDMRGGAGLTKEQLRAVKKGLKNSVFCFSGGPGTGKTHAVAELVRLYGRKDVLLTAPTGKAAMQLKAKVGVGKGGTMHRLLGIKSVRDIIWTNARLSAGLIVVDECSMIDIGMWGAFLSAIQKGTRLILVGDPNQLPPIGVGSFYKEICQWISRDRFACLQKCMRSDRAEIVEMAERVKRGIPIKGRPLKEIDINQFADHFRQENFRILSCMRRGPYGVEAINRHMIEVFEKKWQKGEWHIPVIATKTCDEYGVSNGELGKLIKKKGSSGAGDILCFESGEILAACMPEFEIAYALSVHKSQGSEYDHVALIVPPGSEVFGRQVLYTGITRARAFLDLYGENTTLRMCIEKTEETLSGIGKKLRCLWCVDP